MSNTAKPEEVVAIRERISECECHACKELGRLIALLDHKSTEIDDLQEKMDGGLGPKQSGGPPSEEQLIPCPACCPCGPQMVFLEAHGDSINCPACMRHYRLTPE